MGLLLFYEFCNLHNKVLLFPLSLSFLYLVSSSFPSLVQGGFLNLTLFQSSDGFLARLGCGVLFPSLYFLFVLLFFILTSLLTWLLLISPRSLGVIGRESPTTGSGRSPQWIWSLPALCMLHLRTSPLEITKTSLLGTFKQTVINGGPFCSTTPRQMKFFATFHWGWISRNFLRLFRERFRAVLMTRPFHLASSFLMRAIARTTRVLFLIAFLKESEMVPFWLLAKLVLLTRPISSCPLR